MSPRDVPPEPFPRDKALFFSFQVGFLFLLEGSHVKLAPWALAFTGGWRGHNLALKVSDAPIEDFFYESHIV